MVNSEIEENELFEKLMKLEKEDLASVMVGLLQGIPKDELEKELFTKN